jgi:hypothetical protein
VYFIERETSGFTWGLGWEKFTPPAKAYVQQDSVSLKRFHRETGTVETLDTWETPVQGRVIREYRGRIFNTMSARVDTSGDGVDYLLRMSVPRVPQSEQHFLKGRWTPGAHGAGWTDQWGGMTGYAENVLVQGREVLTVPGREYFPAAIVETADNRDYEVLVSNPAFDDLYPEGIPTKVLQERSRRPLIERARKLRQVHAELVREGREQGLSEGDAELRAADRMEELGYYPKGPRLIASEIEQAAPGGEVFEISEMEFTVGLFRDIRSAIESPGREVKKSMGRYIIHRDFDTSQRLNEWLGSGQTEFVVAYDSRRFLLRVIPGER